MKARRYLDGRIYALRTPAKISNPISFLDDLKPGLIVIYARASSRSQHDNLPDQRRMLRREAEKRGHRVVGDFGEIVAAQEELFSEFDIKRRQLWKALLKAHATGATILAESVFRFRRSSRKRPNTPLTIHDLKWLMEISEGVQLATVVHPDAPLKEIQSYQTRRGRAEKGEHGGRPRSKFPFKERREAKQPKAIQMRRAGFSWGQISQTLNVARSTARGWVG